MWKNERQSLPKSWKRIERLEDWERFKSASDQRLMAVFKHSTQCSRSAYAKHTLEQFFEHGAEPIELHYLDLLSFRSISNRIAEDLKVMHQSPQLILVHHQKAVAHASHEAINLTKMLQSAERQKS